MKLWPMLCRPPKTDMSCWRVLTKCGPLQKGMANHFSILALRTPWAVQFSSVAQSCLTLCDPMDHRTPGLPVQHQFPEFTQTHVHWVSDAIQPSHPLLPPFPPPFNPSQHQGLFKWKDFFVSGGQNIGVSASTSVLSMNTQDRSPLGWTGWTSSQSKGLSRVFSNTTVQKHHTFILVYFPLLGYF